MRLPANGEAGVANVLEIIRAGIDETVMGLGIASLTDVESSNLIMPQSFPTAPANLAPRPTTAAWPDFGQVLWPLPQVAELGCFGSLNLSLHTS
jgi:hypothetical protein